MHTPGVRFELTGSETDNGPRLGWLVTDFAPLLLQRAAKIAKLVKGNDARAAMLQLADLVWDHLAARTFDGGSHLTLWDQPNKIFQQVKHPYEKMSWYYTERVVQGLVNTASIISDRTLRSEALEAIAADLLSEAEHLYDQELLSGSDVGGPTMSSALNQVRAKLERARQIVRERPGTAAVLANHVLGVLDELAAARSNVSEVT
jgi:hypothetical protein